MLKRKWITLNITIALTGILLGLSIWQGNSPLLGLDLQGGTEVVLRPTEEQEYSSEDLDQAREIISRRVNGLGVAEPDITRQGSNIVVQLPGIEDQDRAIDLIGQTAELTFRPVLDGPSYVDISLCAPGAAPTPPEADEEEDDETDDEGATTTTTVVTDATATTGGATSTTTDASTTSTAATSTTTSDISTTSSSTTSTSTTTSTTEAPIGPVAPEPDDETTSEDQVSAENPEAVLSPEDLETSPDDIEAPVIEQPLNLATGAASDPQTALPEDTVIFCSIGDQSDVTPSDPDTPVIANFVERFLLGPAGVTPATPLTGAAIQTASAQFTGVANWLVSLSMKAGEEGIDRFNALSARCYSRDSTCPTQRMAIVLDGNVESAPTVNAPGFERETKHLSLIHI